jgi:hypothetical protein
MGGFVMNNNFNFKPMFGEGNNQSFNNPPLSQHQVLPSMMPGSESLNPSFNQYQQMYNYMQQLHPQPSPVSGDSNIMRLSTHEGGSKNATFGSLNTSFHSDIYPNTNVNNINNQSFNMDSFS